ncbi:hypothetical protein ACLZX5_04090 [Enterococcus faecium]
MEESIKYYGRLDIGTFASRNYFKEYITKDHEVTFRTNNGKIFKDKLTVVYDIVMHPDMKNQFGKTYNYAEKMNDNNIEWNAIINKDGHNMYDTYIYLSALDIEKIEPVVKDGRITDNGLTFTKDSEDKVYHIDLDSIEVYAVDRRDISNDKTLYDSFGYKHPLDERTKLLKGVDYDIGYSTYDPKIKDQMNNLYDKRDDLQAEYNKLGKMSYTNQERLKELEEGILEIDTQIKQLSEQSRIVTIILKDKYNDSKTLGTNKTLIITHKGDNPVGEKAAFSVGLIYTDLENDSFAYSAATSTIATNENKGSIFSNEHKKVV